MAVRGEDCAGGGRESGDVGRDGEGEREGGYEGGEEREEEEEDGGGIHVGAREGLCGKGGKGLGTESWRVGRR